MASDFEKQAERMEDNEFLEFYEALKVKYKEKPEDFTPEMKAGMAMFSMKKMLIYGKRREQNLETIRKNLDLAEEMIDQYVLNPDGDPKGEFARKIHQLAGTEAEDAAMIGGDYELSERAGIINYRYLKAIGVME